MKQLNLNGNTLLAVDVPDDSYSHFIDDGWGAVFWHHTGYKRPYDVGWVGLDLNPGKWSILGRLNDISEEVAALLVEVFTLSMGWSANRGTTSLIRLYMNYNIERPVPVALLCFEATESLKSFFRSHGVEGNPLILKLKQ